MSYRIIPTVDSDTKLFPTPTMLALSVYFSENLALVTPEQVIEALAGITLETLGGATPAEVTAIVTTAFNGLVNAAPEQLDTLKELATALGNDPNFAATLTALIATKATPAQITAAINAQNTVNMAAFVQQTRTVNGKALTADVTLGKGDLGLGNVDNTADTNKPVSTPQASAMAAAVLPYDRPAYPDTKWVFFGHSLVANGIGAAFSAYTSLETYNGGEGSQTSDQIAARFNAPSTTTTAAFTMPADTSSVAVAPLVNPVYHAAVNASRTAFIAGVKGTLAWAYLTGVITFTPTNAIGRAFVVPAGTPILIEEGMLYRNRTAVLWIGRNDNWNDAATRQAVVDRVGNMIAALTPYFRRVMVLEEPPFTSDSATPLANLATLNNMMEAAYPQNFVRLMTWMRTTSAAAAVGLTYTTQDLADIANGYTPTSFRQDAGHLNGLGNSAAAFHLLDVAHTWGWTGPAPSVVKTVWSSDGFSGSAAGSINGRVTDVALGGAAKTWVVSPVSSVTTQLALNGSGHLIRGAAADATFAGIAAVPANAEIAVTMTGRLLGGEVSICRSGIAGGSTNRYRIAVATNGTARIEKYLAGTIAANTSSTPLLDGNVVTLRAVNLAIAAGQNVPDVQVTMLVNDVAIYSLVDTAAAPLGGIAPLTAGGYAGVQTASAGAAFDLDQIIISTVAQTGV